MEPLDPRVRHLVDGAMREAVPDDATQARSLARFLAVLPVTPPPPGPDGGPAADALPRLGEATAVGSGAAATGGGGLKIVALVVALGAAAAGTAVVATSGDTDTQTATRDAQRSHGGPAPASAEPTARPSAREVAPAPPADASAANGVAPEAGHQVVAPAPRRASRARPSAPPATGSGDTLSEEARLIAVADAALQRGDARAVLAVLRDHAKRFPNSQLGLERRALQLAARCIDAPESARAEAVRFLKRHRNAGAAAKVRARCKVGGED